MSKLKWCDECISWKKEKRITYINCIDAIAGYHDIKCISNKKTKIVFDKNRRDYRIKPAEKCEYRRK